MKGIGDDEIPCILAIQTGLYSYLDGALDVMEIDLQSVTISDLSAQLGDGRATARDLVEHCLVQIGVDDGKTNAVIELNPDALTIADQCDAERRCGHVKSPLHGIPILIKDNIDTADSMSTTAGSLALEGSIARQDAGVVTKLRTAGAVVLGKTNLTEWAGMRSLRSCSGWSSRGGQTRNPYVLDRSPDGSSSGSAVAAAAGYCAAAIGTETDGSIILPASFNGVVGIKPTVGLVSRSGIIPISHSQDTAGPLARTVSDAALVLTALAGSDPRDPACADADRRRQPDYTVFLDNSGLKSARIGIHRPTGQLHPGVGDVFENAIRAVRDGGAEVIDHVSLPPMEDVSSHEDMVLCTDFKVDLNAYLSELADTVSVRSLADVIRFNKDHRDTVMRWFPQDVLEATEATCGLDDPTYRQAREICLKLTRTDGIDKAMAQHELDAIITPSGGVPFRIDLENGDSSSGSTSYLAAISGYPSISVPAGYVGGLPVGLSFIARAWAEPMLIRLAYAFEQATQVRQPPEFLATTSI